MTLDINQPIAVVAASAIAGFTSIITMVVNLIQNRSFKRNDAIFSHINARVNQINSDTSLKTAILKEKEIELASNYKIIEIIVSNWHKIKEDIAELLGILEIYLGNQNSIGTEDIKRVSYLCNILSVQISPRGKFDEEFNIQLGHIKSHLIDGNDLNFGKVNFYVAFKMNCWTIIDHKLLEINNSFREGKIVSLDKKDPWKVSDLS